MFCRRVCGTCFQESNRFSIPRQKTPRWRLEQHTRASRLALTGRTGQVLLPGHGHFHQSTAFRSFLQNVRQSSRPINSRKDELQFRAYLRARLARSLVRDKMVLPTSDRKQDCCGYFHESCVRKNDLLALSQAVYCSERGSKCEEAIASTRISEESKTASQLLRCLTASMKLPLTRSIAIATYFCR